MHDIEQLLAETSEIPPAGVDLEAGDAAFSFMDLIARAGGDPEFADPDKAPPSWPEILDEAAAMLDSSKDLRLAVVYTRAATHLTGICGFDAGMKLVEGLLARYWDTLYPGLDFGGPDELVFRVSALAEFADSFSPFSEGATLLPDLRGAHVCEADGKRLSVRDLLIAHGSLLPRHGESPMPKEKVLGILRQAALGSTQRDALACARALPATLAALEARLDSCFGDQAPVVAKLRATLDTLASVCGSVEPSGPPMEDVPRSTDGGATDAQAATASAADFAPDSVAATQRYSAAGAAAIARAETPAPLVRHLATREDAIAMLEAVCAFLERTEPTNPAPLLIRRARVLMEKDFLAIIEELAPESLAQVRLIAGAREP